MSEKQINEGDVRRLFAALTSEVQRQFSITQAAQVFRTAGFASTGVQYWQPLMHSVDLQFAKLEFIDQLRTVRILAERLLDQTYPEDAPARVNALLLAHGFQFIEGNFVPVGLFDERELRFLPETAAGQISTALDRLVNGDLDGALAAASGSVETAAAAVASTSDADSFQQKAKLAIDAVGRLAALQDQLVGLGWKPERASMLCHNLRGTLNQAAMVMQILRSDMSDVHGAKPVLEPVVYDALKLASVLVSFMR
jgi:hypothetical protein